MKKIMVSVLLCALCSIFAFAEFKDIITEPWLKAASITRQSFVERGDVYELIQYDRDVLNRINDGDLVLKPSIENMLIALFHKIVIDNPRPDEKALTKCLDILCQRFEDKSYCANFLLELITANKIPNYRILVKVLDAYFLILSNETASKVFMGLNMMFNKIDAYLFDPYAPGSDLVLRAFMEFIGRYCDMVMNKKTLEDNYREKIYEFADKLDLGKNAENNRMSQYSHISNWEKVGQAFYFYKIREEFIYEDNMDSKEANGK